MDVTFVTWNVRNLHMSSSMTVKARDFAKYKLHLMGVQEVRWGKGGTEPAVIRVFIEMRLTIMN
jgi:hypothetical protein